MRCNLQIVEKQREQEQEKEEKEEEEEKAAAAEHLSVWCAPIDSGMVDSSTACGETLIFGEQQPHLHTTNASAGNASRTAEASKTAYGARKTASNTPKTARKTAETACNTPRSLTTPAAQAHGGGVHAHGGGGGRGVEGEGGGGSEKRQQVRAMIHKVKNSPAALRKQKPPESPAQLGAKIRSISAQKSE